MKILVVTTIYPRNDVKKVTAATKVVHYFAEQWKKSGHEVYVVHTAGHTFRLLHLLPQKIKDIVKTKTGNEITDVNITRKCRYLFGGIKVFRRPVFKGVSRSLVTQRNIAKICKEIKQELDRDGFVPELVISHWSNPTVQILSELKRYYSCKKSIVFHEKYYIPVIKAKLQEQFNDIDAVGCRSKTLAQDICHELDLKKMPFVCASGVPDAYLNKFELNTDKFNQPVERFIFVGELLSRKYCATVVEALAVSGKGNWHLDIVGTGSEMSKLKQITAMYNIEERVTFHGRVPRDKVMELMSNAQCFIMPSKSEAFGLVYLEAMASSCIVVGSKREGIDGIIINGKNGFLVDAGSVENLKKTIEDICLMSQEDIKTIVENGYDTAHNYSDSVVAQRYLEDVINW